MSKYALLLLVVVLSRMLPSPVYARTYDVVFTSRGFSPANLTVVTSDIARISNETDTTITLTTIPISSGTNTSFVIGTIDPRTKVATTFNTPGTHLLSSEEFPQFTSTITIQALTTPEVATNTAVPSDGTSTPVSVNDTTQSAMLQPTSPAVTLIPEYLTTGEASGSSSPFASNNLNYLMQGNVPLISLSIVAIVASLLLAYMKTRNPNSSSPFELKPIDSKQTPLPKESTLTKLEQIASNIDHWTQVVRHKGKTKPKK